MLSQSPWSVTCQGIEGEGRGEAASVGLMAEVWATANPAISSGSLHPFAQSTSMCLQTRGDIGYSHL